MKNIESEFFLKRKETEINETENKSVFDVISKERINEYKEKLRMNAGIQLSDIAINILHPEDDLFDHYEIQHKLFLKYNSNWEKMIDVIKSHKYNPDNITIEQFRDIAAKENIKLEGKFPGFAMTAGGDEINFFGIKEKNVMEMAIKYAKKEGEGKINFSNTEVAKKYLKNLGEKYFLHEVGHIIYKKLKQSSLKEWGNFVEGYPDFKKLVIEIQKDKYNNKDKIPVSEEAFADFFIDVSSNGNLISRLGINDKAIKKVKSLLKETTRKPRKY